jgi:hypothetical protein
MLILTKNGLGHILGDFSTNSFCQPAKRSKWRHWQFCAAFFKFLIARSEILFILNGIPLQTEITCRNVGHRSPTCSRSHKNIRKQNENVDRRLFKKLSIHVGTETYALVSELLLNHCNFLFLEWNYIDVLYSKSQRKNVSFHFSSLTQKVTRRGSVYFLLFNLRSHWTKM